MSIPFCHTLYAHFSSAEAYTLFPDVITCLQRLSSANVTMGVISDFDIRLEGVLQGLGISSYFRFIVQSFVEGYNKPSTELWKAALVKAGTVESGWHVGDDPGKDSFVDATTIILDRENGIATNFQKISSLKDVPRLVGVE